MLEMRDNPRRGMDPVIVKAFINLTGIYPVGTLVVLDTFELGDRPRGQPAPGHALATHRSHHQRRPGQPVASRRRSPTSPIATPDGVSSARSSRRRTLIDMASGSATISSDADRAAFRRAARGASGARSFRTSRPAIPTPSGPSTCCTGSRSAGADVIELGLPFSDPMADGPVIQASSQRALEQGMNFDRLLELVARAHVSVPLVLFSYLNPVIAAGGRRARRAPRRPASAGFCSPTCRSAPIRSAKRGSARAARLHSPRRADDAAERMREIADARQRIRLPDQPARRDGRARRSARRAPGDGARLRERDDPAGLRGLRRFAPGAGGRGRAHRRRRRRRQRASSAPPARASTQAVALAVVAARGDRRRVIRRAGKSAPSTGPRRGDVEITLHAMRFHGLVGILPHERSTPQPIEIDLR